MSERLSDSASFESALPELAERLLGSEEDRKNFFGSLPPLPDILKDEDTIALEQNLELPLDALCFSLYWIDQLGFEEIAQELGVPAQKLMLIFTQLGVPSVTKLSQKSWKKKTFLNALRDWLTYRQRSLEAKPYELIMDPASANGLLPRLSIPERMVLEHHRERLGFVISDKAYQDLQRQAIDRLKRLRVPLKLR